MELLCFFLTFCCHCQHSDYGQGHQPLHPLHSIVRQRVGNKRYRNQVEECGEMKEMKSRSRHFIPGEVLKKLRELSYGKRDGTLLSPNVSFRVQNYGSGYLLGGSRGVRSLTSLLESSVMGETGTLGRRIPPGSKREYMLVLLPQENILSRHFSPSCLGNQTAQQCPTPAIPLGSLHIL